MRTVSSPLAVSLVCVLRGKKLGLRNSRFTKKLLITVGVCVCVCVSLREKYECESFFSSSVLNSVCSVLSSVGVAVTSQLNHL